MSSLFRVLKHLFRNPELLGLVIIGILVVVLVLVSIKNLKEKKLREAKQHHEPVHEKPQAPQPVHNEVSRRERLGELISEMHHLDLIPMDEPFDIEFILRTHDTSIDMLEESSGIIQLLFGYSRRGLMWDCESGRIPPNYEDLIPEFFKMVDDVVHTFEHALDYTEITDGDDIYLLKLIANGKEYQQQLRDFGDYYDIESVVNVFNQILGDLNASPKILELGTDDQAFCVFRGYYDKIKALHVRYGLELYVN